jgi:predicted RNA-binding protein YlqC (UPF0109 family)
MDSASSLTLSVPADKIGSVIGQGGSGLRRLGQEAGVKVIVPRELTATGERSIEMVGAPEQLQRAQQLVLELMEGGGKGAAAGMTNKRKLPLDFVPGTYSRPVQQCFFTPPSAMLHAPAALPSPYMTQPMMTEHMGPMASTPLEARLILDGDKIGSIVGKAGAGLKQLREGTGSTFTLTRDFVVGGRMLVVNPPLDAQQRCIASICERLSAGDNASAEPTVTLKLLVPSTEAGKIIGKAGNGFKELRALGVTVDMQREDVAPGERLLSTTGPAQAVSVAINTVVAKLAAA